LDFEIFLVRCVKNPSFFGNKNLKKKKMDKKKLVDKKTHFNLPNVPESSNGPAGFSKNKAKFEKYSKLTNRNGSVIDQKISKI